MAQTAFRARPALNRHSTVAARRSQREEMLLFQAFLRPPFGEVQISPPHHFAGMGVLYNKT